MGGLREVLHWLFSDANLGKKQKHTLSHTRRSQSPTVRISGAGRSKHLKAEVLQSGINRPPVPYWQLRGWRRVKDNLYLGYFKTRLGRCHGVVKWSSQFNYGIYIHDVPAKILNGPHAACFSEVKPGKYRVHFAQRPRDLNSAIFYMETLIQEAFNNG